MGLRWGLSICSLMSPPALENNAFFQVPRIFSRKLWNAISSKVACKVGDVALGQNPVALANILRLANLK